jgi:diguanylate cyclase (GGDEF)-like protein
MNVPGGENVAMPLRDARLEELEYLAELERDWEGRTEKHAGDTPRRRLIAHLILVGDVNGADYLGQLPVNVIESGNPQYFQRSMDGNRVRDIGSLLGGKEIRVKISHQGRVRKSEIEQQLRSGREREPFGILISKRHLQIDLALALVKCDSQFPVTVGVIDMNGLNVINNASGHNAGDEAIKGYLLAVAGVLQTRGEGYRGDGSDEVFVIIPALPFSQAAEIARCILQEINRKRLAQWPEVRLSASFGLAWTADPSQNPDDLVSRADDLMYRAKQKSKDVATSHLALQGSATIEVIDSAPTG